MIQKLYVANFAFSTTDRDLERLFREFGQVESARVAKDRDSSRPKGFGFVEMADMSQARAAIAGLHGKEIQGRALIVQEYRPREEGAGARRPAARPARAPQVRKKRSPPLGKHLRKPRPKA